MSETRNYRAMSAMLIFCFNCSLSPRSKQKGCTDPLSEPGINCALSLPLAANVKTLRNYLRFLKCALMNNWRIRISVAKKVADLREEKGMSNKKFGNGKLKFFNAAKFVVIALSLSDKVLDWIVPSRCRNKNHHDYGKRSVTEFSG